MNVDHNQIIIDNFTYLKDSVLISGGSKLLGILLEVGVLDFDEIEQIKSKPTSKEKMDELLRLVIRSSQEQYCHFLDSLKEDGYENVYDELTGKIIIIISV